MSLNCIIVSTILMILLAGILGGGINCLQARKAGDPVPRSIWYYFLLSIASAFSVPLFLSLTKSSLLGDILTTTQTKLDEWFILFAICLVAAIYAQTFLESVSKNLLQRVQAAEDTSQEAKQNSQMAATTATEALNKAEATGESSLNAAPDATAKARFASAVAATASMSAAADPQVQKVLDALKNPKYPLGNRTLGGIVLETKLSRQAVSAILDQLIAEGTVHKTSGEISGTDYYSLKSPAG